MHAYHKSFYKLESCQKAFCARASRDLASSNGWRGVYARERASSTGQKVCFIISRVATHVGVYVQHFSVSLGAHISAHIKRRHIQCDLL